MKIQINRSEVLDSGVAKAPTSAQLDYGELAINYDSSDPTLFYKDNSDTVRNIKLGLQPDLTNSSNQAGTLDDRYLKLSGGTLTGDLTGTNFIGGVSRIGSNAPTATADGELWYNTNDGRIYVRYTDGDGDSQWVDASPDTYSLDNTYYTKTESDARYLGINDTADDSTLLAGQAASYYLDYTNFSNTPNLATVATSGSYNDLTDQPSLVGNTDLSYTASTRELASSTGNNVTLPEVVAAGDSGLMTGADKTKLDGIEASATADQTGAEIKAAYEGEADTNAFTDAEKTKLAGIATGAEVNVATDLSYTASTRELASSTGTNATLPEVVAAGDSGLMTGADKTKLDAIEAGATADQTGAEIKSAYEAEADTNAFTDAEKTKLSGIAAGAEVNVATDLSYTAATRELASSTGNNVTLPEAVAAGASGLLTGADKTKIDEIGLNDVIQTAKVLDENITIQTGYNALSINDVEVSNGVTIEVPEDSIWITIA